MFTFDGFEYVFSNVFSSKKPGLRDQRKYFKTFLLTMVRGGSAPCMFPRRLYSRIAHKYLDYSIVYFLGCSGGGVQ